MLDLNSLWEKKGGVGVEVVQPASETEEAEAKSAFFQSQQSLPDQAFECQHCHHSHPHRHHCHFYFVKCHIGLRCFWDPLHDMIIISSVRSSLCYGALVEIMQGTHFLIGIFSQTNTSVTNHHTCSKNMNQCNSWLLRAHTEQCSNIIQRLL